MAMVTRRQRVESGLGVTRPHQEEALRPQAAAAESVRFAAICENGIVTILAAAVAFTTLASGAVEPWSVAIFELIVVFLIVLWGGKCLYERRVLIAVPPAALPMGVMVLLGVAQSLALRDSEGNTWSLSLDVEATRSAALALFLLLVCFLAAANFLIGRKHLRLITRCLVIYGLVMAVFALVQHLSQEGRTYWLRPLSQGASWFGPFVNHAHFAGYMALLIPIPIGLMMNRAARSEERFLFASAAAMMGVSLVASLSRGGLIALASELLFLLIAGSPIVLRLMDTGNQRSVGAPLKGPRLKSLVGLGVVTVSIIVGVLQLGPEPVANRIARGNATGIGHTESLYESRGWIWRDSIRVFEAHPLLGAGMGAFETAFPIYSRSDGSLLVSQSHSDYLQVLTDCGIVGGFLAIWFIVAIWSVVFKGLRSHDPFRRSLALGCGAAIFGMMVHSLFDFNLQLPSTALLFLLICAIASPPRLRKHGNKKE